MKIRIPNDDFVEKELRPQHLDTRERYYFYNIMVTFQLKGAHGSPFLLTKPHTVVIGDVILQDIAEQDVLAHNNLIDKLVNRAKQISPWIYLPTLDIEILDCHKVKDYTDC